MTVTPGWGVTDGPLPSNRSCYGPECITGNATANTDCQCVPLLRVCLSPHSFVALIFFVPLSKPPAPPMPSADLRSRNAHIADAYSLFAAAVNCSSSTPVSGDLPDAAHWTGAAPAGDQMGLPQVSGSLAASGAVATPSSSSSGSNSGTTSGSTGGMAGNSNGGTTGGTTKGSVNGDANGGSNGGTAGSASGGTNGGTSGGANGGATSSSNGGSSGGSNNAGTTIGFRGGRPGGRRRPPGGSNGGSGGSPPSSPVSSPSPSPSPPPSSPNLAAPPSLGSRQLAANDRSGSERPGADPPANNETSEYVNPGPI